MPVHLAMHVSKLMNTAFSVHKAFLLLLTEPLWVVYPRSLGSSNFVPFRQRTVKEKALRHEHILYFALLLNQKVNIAFFSTGLLLLLSHATQHNHFLLSNVDHDRISLSCIKRKNKTKWIAVLFFQAHNSLGFSFLCIRPLRFLGKTHLVGCCIYV